eukprot:1432609-Rhodomonas_salina.2
MGLPGCHRRHCGAGGCRLCRGSLSRHDPAAVNVFSASEAADAGGWLPSVLPILTAIVPMHVHGGADGLWCQCWR